MELLEPHNLIPPGVYTLDGMMKYGEDNKQCPYFTARRMVFCFNLKAYSRCRSVMSLSIHTIIFSIQRSLNEFRENCQKTASSSLMRLIISVYLNCNLLSVDNVCIESLSIDLFDDTLKKATRGVTSLEKKIEKYSRAVCF